MARTIKFSKEDILEKSVEFIKEKGYSNLTVRELAKYIGCSTQPIFKNYENFDEYKKDLKIYLSNDYKSFISKYINDEFTAIQDSELRKLIMNISDSSSVGKAQIINSLQKVSSCNLIPFVAIVGIILFFFVLIYFSISINCG